MDTTELPNIIIDDYFKEKKDDDSYTLYADFRTIDDFKIFLKMYDLKETMPAFIIKGFHPKYRIYKHKYYTLNLDILDRNSIRTVSESHIYGYELQLTKTNQDQAYLLNKSDYTEGIILHPSIFNNITFPISNFGNNVKNNLSVIVHNVNQGNWNEVDLNNTAILVFDTGTTITASYSEIQSVNKKIITKYLCQDQKPMLILSHWDKDHYNCILGMDNSQIGSFYGFVFPHEIPNATSQLVYNKMSSILGHSKMHPVDIPIKTRSLPALPTPITKIGPFTIYAGKKCSDRNLGGIQVFVLGEEGNVVLTGDCGWFQLMHILSQEEKNIPEGSKCNIIVPHHGSGKDETYSGFVITGKTHPGTAMVSVNRHKNRYGHPSKKVLYYLKNTLKFTVERTDIINKSITINL